MLLNDSIIQVLQMYVCIVTFYAYILSICGFCLHPIPVTVAIMVEQRMLEFVVLCIVYCQQKRMF